MNTIALDVMGGDKAPSVTIEGAIRAVKKYKLNIILVGQETVIQEELNKNKFVHSNISIYPAEEIIGMNESPGSAVRHKQNSSIVVATKLVSEGKAQAVVSAGNSGAVMASAMTLLRKLDGIARPAISAIFPTLNGSCGLLDVGANVDCKPKHLVQFAVMGNVYMKEMFGISSPKVGLLSIGEEQIKGNELTLQTYGMLNDIGVNFVGNIEGRDIPFGKVEVAVCDGFVGNIILKFGEGIAEMLFSLIKSELKKHPLAFVSIPFIWGVLKGLMKRVDYTEYGGAPLLGVNGVCIVCHGKSNSKAIANALRVADMFVDRDINQKISSEIKKHKEVVGAE